GKEVEIVEAIMTLGRTSENVLSFTEDSNVSRFHAEIEKRAEGDYWLIDLGSSNGTELNGNGATEAPLNDGDEIVLGGSTVIRFAYGTEEEKKEEPEAEEEESEAADAPETAKPDAAAAGTKSSNSMYLLVFAAIAIGLGVVLAVAAMGFYFSKDTTESASGCTAAAEIISPENGDILSESTSVEIEIDNGSCVDEVIFEIGGKEFARTQDPPYEVTLDPDRFANMSDGRDRKINIVLIDSDGNKIRQNNEIAISIETIEAATPTPETPGGGTPVDTKNGDNSQVPVQTSLIDTQEMAKAVLPKITGNSAYNINNQQFLSAVAKMTAEYRSEGFYARALKYRDVINYQYLREQNLDPSLGYVLAMSRTKFQPVARAEGAGLWRMNNQLVLDNAYNGICGAETIASETQKCAAIASSSYLKDIILNVFNGDVIYGVAAFGMDKQEAALWNASLPNDPAVRRDFWKVIRNPQRKQEVVRFFAAALVLENPKKFGLDRDMPISTLYPAYAE
ncbi:MAG: FHA domain-containing protein, partial [Pyrinomonadaceae bacterium]|nr:FHA domain-containing protein [Pyrinomonadaceae bacterium]